MRYEIMFVVATFLATQIANIHIAEVFSQVRMMKHWVMLWHLGMFGYFETERIQCNEESFLLIRHQGLKLVEMMHR